MESTLRNYKEKTLLGYTLNQQQNAVLNHLVPAVAACSLYIFIIAVDIGVIFRHCKDSDPIWASLTLFIMYLPVIGSFIMVVTDIDYWPEPDDWMSNDNSFWLYKKVLAHLFFPVWNMWRYAERIFWSIEAVRNNSEESVENAMLKAMESRLVELYVFLQSYLHSLPQVLLQLHILMRHNADIARESKNTQALCILLNLAKVAVTTTYYQRFKAQKLTGSQYPWLKKRKILRSRGTSLYDQDVVLRRSTASQKRVIEKESNQLDEISRLYDIQPAALAERRRSSDIYLEPEPENVSTVVTDSHHQELARVQHHASSVPSNSKTPHRNSYIERLSSMLTIKPHEPTVRAISNTSFNIARITYAKGLEEDDLAGKTISFLWWYTFLFGRVLAISAFAYFFMIACVWLLISHVILVIVILSYDVRSDNVKRDKVVFFIFIGIVYIFCIIEFKIRFKKTKFIYLGYFGLVLLENGIMCIVWYYKELDSLENDYWFRYIFYTIIASGLLSLSSMIFYHILTKPKAVSVRVT